MWGNQRHVSKPGREESSVKVQFTSELRVWKICLAYLTTELNLILGLKQQKLLCWLSASEQLDSVSTIPPGGRWWWNFVSQTHSLEEQPCGTCWCLQALPSSGFRHWPGHSFALGRSSASPSLWPAPVPSVWSAPASGGRTGGCPADFRVCNGKSPSHKYIFQLPTFETFMKGLDWKRIETCIQKQHVSLG